MSCRLIRRTSIGTLGSVDGSWLTSKNVINLHVFNALYFAHQPNCRFNTDKNASHFCRLTWALGFLARSMKITLRWIAFSALALPTAFITYWNSTRLLNRLFQPLCPVGFWRTDILFAPNFCAYTPIFTLAESLCFFLTEVAVLLLVFVLPDSHRLRTARALLILFVAFPVAEAWWQGVGWLTLGHQVASLLSWLILAVAYHVAPKLRHH